MTIFSRPKGNLRVFPLAGLVLLFLLSASAQDYGIGMSGDQVESWQTYLNHKTAIDQRIATAPVDDKLIGLAFGVARSAIAVEDIDTLHHIDAAFDVLDRIPAGNNYLYSLADSTPRILMYPLLAKGFIETADEVNERTKKLPKGSDLSPELAAISAGMVSNTSDQLLANYLNDYATVEEMILRVKAQTDAVLTETPSVPALAFMHLASAQMQWLNLAEVQAKQGKEDEARASLQEAISIELADDSNVQEYGDYLQLTKISHSLLFAEINFLLGEYEKAEAFLSDSEVYLKSYQYAPSQTRNVEVAYHILRGQLLFELGRADEIGNGWDRALELVREANEEGKLPFPDHNPYVAAIHEARAWTLLQTGSPEAKQAALRLNEIRKDVLLRLFEFASEKQRLAYHQSADPFSLLIAAGDVDALATAVVNFKGAVLDSILEDRRIAGQIESSETEALLRELRFAKLLAQNADNGQASGLEEKAQRVRQLEEDLSNRQPGLRVEMNALTTTLSDIQKQLHPSDRLCEYVRYRKVKAEGGTEPFYGAIVISKEGSPTWTELAPTSDIDPLIAELRNAMSGQVIEDALFEALLQRLYSLLVAPLESNIPAGSRLILSPDGPLSCLSFAVLLDGEKKFLAERWDLFYVSTARDLLKLTTPPSSEMKLGIYANPAFAASSSTTSTEPLRRNAFPFDIPGIALPPLPGTANESDALFTIGKSAGWKVATFTENDATEQAVMKFAPRAEIVHFATHGLFLEKNTTVATSTRQPLSMTQKGTQSDDPLQRAMLTLAGADETFRSWRENTRPDPASDGILTAAEIASLDLSATWLATLSACDTAIGENFDGEGVMGLRRGFFLAGVDHLVMTFWPIADEETVALMRELYSDLASSSHPGISLANVQKQALIEYRENRSLYEAVFLAGPFAASITGPLP